MEIEKRAIQGFTWNHLAKVFDYVLVVLFSILLARNLGALQFGIYATVISVTTLFLHLSSLGFGEVLTKYSAQLLSQNEGKSRYRFAVKKLFSGRVIFIAMCCMSLFAFRTPLAQLFRNETLATYIMIIVFYVFFQSLVNLNVNLLLGVLQTKPIFAIGVASRMVNLTVAYVLLTRGYEIREILVLITVVSFCTLIFYFLQNRTYFSGPGTRFDLKPMVNFGLTVWGISLLTFILGRQSDILLLNYFLGNSSQVGYYEVAFSFTQAVGYTFVIGLTGVSLAMFSELAVTDLPKLAKSWELILKGMQLVLIPVLLYFIIYAGEIIPIIYTTSFNRSVILFRLFAIFMLTSWIMGGGMNMTALYSMGLQKSVLLSRSLSGLMNIVLNILLIPKLQAMGAIIATGCSTILAISIELLLVRSRIPVRFPFKFFLKIVAISILSLFTTFLYEVSNIGTLLVAGLQYLLLIIFFIFIFKIIDLKELFLFISKSEQ